MKTVEYLDGAMQKRYALTCDARESYDYRVMMLKRGRVAVRTPHPKGWGESYERDPVEAKRQLAELGITEGGGTSDVG